MRPITGLPLCLAAALIAVQPGQAHAGDAVLYQPSPAWVDVLPTPPAGDADAPSNVLDDTQERVENSALWSYTDKAIRIASPDELAKLTTLTLQWTPDKGDLIIHELSILRDGKRIDLIAAGQKFTVIRREEDLEKREITGILTATLEVAGLQVGDILRLRASTTNKDAALGGHVQGEQALIAMPQKIGVARYRLSWPDSDRLQVRLLADGVTPTITRAGGYTSETITLPIAKQPEMPDDAPVRFRHQPFVEFDDFADWRDVSKVMAPLFKTEGTIAPGSDLATAADAIAKAQPDPLHRAEAALELVQDKVRYLAVLMNGGNYVPQAPAKTWALRYGDCKAKTLLLLALLHHMGIEAEPVLAHATLGDLVPSRLAAAQAFNHVLVHARIAGQDLWLDGTRSNSRLVDITDTPAFEVPFENVLPLRAAGADLLTLTAHANGRPAGTIEVETDESTSSDLPMPVTARMIFTREVAAGIAALKGSADDKSLREASVKVFGTLFGDSFQVADAAIEVDATNGTASLTVHGVADSAWQIEDRKRKRAVAPDADKSGFTANRSRPTWAAIPVATGGPQSGRFTLVMKLPDGGKGITIEGEAAGTAHVGGRQVARSLTLAGPLATFDQQLVQTAEEIPAPRVPAERDAAAALASKSPRLIAGSDTLRWWQLTPAQIAASTQARLVEADYAKIIANDPDDVTGLGYLAFLHNLLLDRKAAVADLTRAIAVAPSVWLYVTRAGYRQELGDLAGAQADADAARALDPSAKTAIGKAAWIRAFRGDLAGGVALLEAEIAKGGKTADDYREAKASVIGEFGDAAEAVGQLDALAARKPGSPSLLNGRCWVKGTRNIMLDTALKDCTSAIELSSDSSAALDSRAMVYFRLGRMDEALADLDAVLADNPEQAQSHFLRAVILKARHRTAESAADLAAARNLKPSIDVENKVYGIGI